MLATYKMHAALQHACSHFHKIPCIFRMFFDLHAAPSIPCRSALNAGTSETLSVTNTKVLTVDDIVVASMGPPCAGGVVSVIGVQVTAVGAFSVTVRNVGANPCTDAYSVVSLAIFRASFFFCLLSSSRFTPFLRRFLCLEFYCDELRVSGPPHGR